MANTTHKLHTLMVIMDYPGGSISKNRLWNGGDRRKGMNKTARKWKHDLVWSITAALYNARVRPQLPVTVRIGGSFTDRAHAPDLHNLSELVCDAVERATGVNDRYMTVETVQAEYGVVEPEIRVEVVVGVGGVE